MNNYKLATFFWFSAAVLYFVVCCLGIIVDSLQSSPADSVFVDPFVLIIILSLIFGLSSVRIGFNLKNKGIASIKEGRDWLIASLLLFGFITGNILIFGVTFARSDPTFFLLLVPFILILFFDMMILFVSIKK